jgi:hypothetical protein
VNVECERLKTIASGSRYSAGVNEQMVRRSYAAAAFNVTGRLRNSRHALCPPATRRGSWE